MPLPTARLTHHTPRALTIPIPDLRFSPDDRPSAAPDVRPLSAIGGARAEAAETASRGLTGEAEGEKLACQLPLCYDHGLLPPRLSLPWIARRQQARPMDR
jgi:hypothetical protein